jgi:CRISPR-associated protein Cmr5
MRQTMDQQRAKHAWQIVTNALVLEEKDRKNFGREAKRLPSRIMGAGLGHAIAFLQQKRTAPLLEEGISSWIALQNWSGESPDQPVRSIISMIMEKDREFSRMATEEAMNLLVWVVRFAGAKGLTDENEADQEQSSQEVAR